MQKCVLTVASYAAYYTSCITVSRLLDQIGPRQCSDYVLTCSGVSLVTATVVRYVVSGPLDCEWEALIL